MKHELISFPASNTYNLVNSTLIHAHPANHRSYPKYVPEYIAVRKQGGIMEWIYSVEKVIDVEPSNIAEYQNSLQSEDYSALALYVNERNKTFGFETSGPYRFYILRKYKELSPPRIKTPNLRGYYYSTVDEIEAL